jgi:hypothetical protein
MANTEQSRDEKYEGPSKTIEALGKANAVGWGGSLVGFLGGALVASLSTKENSTFAKKGEEFVSWVTRGKLNVSGKNAIIVGMGLVGSQIVHWGSYFLTFGHAKKNAGKGQKQFERIKQERDAAKQELEAVKSELDVIAQEKQGQHANDDTGMLDRSEAPTRHVHAGVVEAGKDAAAEIAR